MDLGVNHIDTANIYGMGLAEDIIGEFIRDAAGAARDFFVIASKVGINRGNKEKPFRNDPEHIKAELDDTLKRLGVETIDLYYIHRREADIPIEDVAGTLKDLIATGKIKSFGFSEIAPVVFTTHRPFTLSRRYNPNIRCQHGRSSLACFRRQQRREHLSLASPLGREFADR